MVNKNLEHDSRSVPIASFSNTMRISVYYSSVPLLFSFAIRLCLPYRVQDNDLCFVAQGHFILQVLLVPYIWHIQHRLILPTNNKRYSENTQYTIHVCVFARTNFTMKNRYAKNVACIMSETLRK